MGKSSIDIEREFARSAVWFRAVFAITVLVILSLVGLAVWAIVKIVNHFV